MQAIELLRIDHMYDDPPIEPGYRRLGRASLRWLPRHDTAGRACDREYPVGQLCQTYATKRELPFSPDADLDIDYTYLMPFRAPVHPSKPYKRTLAHHASLPLYRAGRHDVCQSLYWRSRAPPREAKLVGSHE